MPDKKLKGKPFTNAEIEVLFTLVKKYHDIIGSKNTDAVSWKDKNKYWSIVSDEFNAQGVAEQIRSAESLRNKWKHLKKDAKRAYLEGRINVKKGSSNEAVRVQKIHLQIKALCPDNFGIIGKRNIYDSDRDLKSPFMELEDESGEIEDESAEVEIEYQDLKNPFIELSEECGDLGDKYECFDEVKDTNSNGPSFTEAFEIQRDELRTIQKEYFKNVKEKAEAKIDAEASYWEFKMKAEEVKLKLELEQLKEKHAWEKKFAQIQHEAILQKIAASK